MENGLPFWPQILQKLFRIFCFLAAGTIDAKPDKKEKSPQQSEKPANVQAKNKFKKNGLHIACLKGHIQVAKVLIKYSIYLNKHGKYQFIYV